MENTEKSKKPKKIILFLTLFLLLAVIIGAAAFIYPKINQKPSPQSTLGTQTDNPNTEIIENVRKLVDMPTNETPTIAVVNDTSKLKDQNFFAKAQNGDRVLVFSLSKRAILYRPSTNKIIEIAPVNVDTDIATNSAQTTKPQTIPTSTPKSSPTPTPITTSTPQILLLNGTTTPGLSTKLESPIKTFYPNAEFKKQTASKSDYPKTLIIPVSETGKSIAKKLAVELNLEFTEESPYGEDITGENDLVVIVGQDKI